jgi:beta-glucuronidase
MLYPQQNLFRDKLDLSGLWDFQADPDQTGESQGWQRGLEEARPIAVPGSWNEQYEDLYHYLGLAWYAKSTFIPPSWKGRHIFLRVGSACYFCTVYVNGIKIGSHEGGHLPFAFEITNHIRWNEENRIVLNVENELKPTRVPSGNIPSPLLPIASFPQTTFDFFPFAGIHRPVVLFSVAQTFIEDITVITEIEGANGILKVSIRLNDTVEAKGTIRVNGGDTAITQDITFTDGQTEAVLTVPNACFWSDRHPYLYDLTVSTDQDQYTLKVGIRTIEVENGRILLNGLPVTMKGFGRHEDFIASGKGLNLPLLIKDHQLMRWTGANSYRTSHYPYSEEEMQLADREGFLVINEIPAVSLLFDSDESSAQRLRLCLQQIDELIERDKNHPSVVIWSVANEPMTPRLDSAIEDNALVEKGQHFLESLMDRARELDPSRPVTFAALQGSPNGWLKHCDVLCLNRYWGWYALGGQLDRALVVLEKELDSVWETWHKPVILTEFGADTLAGMHGHPDLMWTEEYQAEYLRGHLEVAARKTYIAGTHVWNFADFAAVQSIMRVGGMNMKGVFTRTRTPKMAAHVLRQFWVKSP